MKKMARKRPKGTERNKGKRRSEHGIITVFVTLMMVPVVAISGIMVDVSRLKLYSSQAVMAADSYGDGVLSEFDNLLKDLYGLFSVSQNEEGLKAIEDLKEYVTYSFKPDGDERGFEGFMPYKDADVEVAWEKVDGASLSNNNVLMTQIGDFMRYRVVEEVLEGSGILSDLEKFDNMANDMEVMEKRNDITDSSAKALGEIDEYYKELKKLAAYPAYLDDREAAFLGYSRKLKEIVNSDKYRDYAYYVEHQDEIDAVLEEFSGESGAIEENGEPEDNEDVTEGDETEEENEEDEEEAEELAKKVELYDRFKDFDASEYKKELKATLNSYSENAKNHDSLPIDFDNADNVIDTLGRKAANLQDTLDELEEQISSLREKLDTCSEDVQKGIEEEIEGLEKILEIKDEFGETWALVAHTHDDKAQNQSNKDFMEDCVPDLDVAKDKIVDGEAEPGNVYWYQTTSFRWYDFMDDKRTFYEELSQLCENGKNGEGDKKAGDREINRAEEAQKNAQKELDGDEQAIARDISDSLASQLASGGASSGTVPDLSDYFSGGLSFDALSKAGSNVINKFLLTTYDFGMFSSRVSGIEPKEDESSFDADVDLEPGNIGESSDEEYADYSLTKVKMSPDVNYLYGAELEYLFGGHNKSSENLNETRNIICGVRLTMNFTSTYIIDEVDKAINMIANRAAEAVAASGVGAAAAPLVRVAVSGALRLAVASIEMAADWSCLKNREGVILLKEELEELKSAEALAGLLGIEIEKSESDSGLELSYENYLYILLCLLVDDNTLLSRTANLITLNVNQAKNDGDTLTELDFKMQDTVTAVKSTCKVKADFVVLPDNIATMFFARTDTEGLIEVLENKYFGYSVIRGY